MPSASRLPLLPQAPSSVCMGRLSQPCLAYALNLSVYMYVHVHSNIGTSMRTLYGMHMQANHELVDSSTSIMYCTVLATVCTVLWYASPTFIRHNPAGRVHPVGDCDMPQPRLRTGNACTRMTCRNMKPMSSRKCLGRTVVLEPVMSSGDFRQLEKQNKRKGVGKRGNGHMDVSTSKQPLPDNNRAMYMKDLHSHHQFRFERGLRARLVQYSRALFR